MMLRISWLTSMLREALLPPEASKRSLRKLLKST